MPETKRDWSERDELAADFMAAMLQGEATHNLREAGETLATTAYALADAFLTVRENMARKK